MCEKQVRKRAKSWEVKVLNCGPKNKAKSEKARNRMWSRCARDNIENQGGRRGGYKSWTGGGMKVDGFEL